jgi:RIO-like serine/threonine protein kinase
LTKIVSGRQKSDKGDKLLGMNDDLILDLFRQEEFEFSSRFQLLDFLGAGSEGEVFLAQEKHTKMECALKFFEVKRNPAFKVSSRIARKLHKLRSSPIVLDYYSHEVHQLGGQRIACLAMEYIRGEKLEDFVAGQRGERLDVFPALHLLYSLVQGVESIHARGEYHGDLHYENIMIRKFGLNFDLKIIDLHHWGDSKQSNREEDILNCIRIFYDILGGQKRYAKHSPSIRYIIGGLKRSLILSRFRTIADLRRHLEKMDWSDSV